MDDLFGPDHRHFIDFLKATFQSALRVQRQKNKIYPVCITYAVNNCLRHESVKVALRNPRGLKHSTDLKTTMTNVALHFNYGHMIFDKC